MTPLEVPSIFWKRYVLADNENLETKLSTVAAPPGDDAPAPSIIPQTGKELNLR